MPLRKVSVQEKIALEIGRRPDLKLLRDSLVGWPKRSLDLLDPSEGGDIVRERFTDARGQKHLTARVALAIAKLAQSWDPLWHKLMDM